MASYSVSGSSTTPLTLTVSDSLNVTSSGLLKPAGPAVTWAQSGTGTAIVDNYGRIAPTSGRALDTSGSGSSNASFVLRTYAGSSIVGVSDVMRIQKGFNEFTLSNAGGITAQAGRGLNFQEYSGVQNVYIVNTPTGTIQSTDDAIRFTTASAKSDASQNTAFAGHIYITNNGAIQTVGAGSGQALDLSDVNGTSANAVVIYNQGPVSGVPGAVGTITAADADAVRLGRNAFLANFGQITAKNATASSTGNDGIDFQTGGFGRIVNGTSSAGGSDPSITGARHGVTGAQPITVDNYGTITGQLGSGINLDTAANTTTTVTNYTFGVISGTAAGSSDGDGIDVDGLISLNNYGTIKALGTWSGGLSEAVTVGGGSITNNAGGLITSVQRAITVDDSNLGAAFAPTTINNAGTINGDNGEAIVITDTFADTLTNTGIVTGSVALGGGDDVVNLYLGSSLSGLLDGGAGADTLTLYGRPPGGPYPPVNGVLNAVTNVETLVVSAGQWGFSTSLGFSSGVSIAGGATLLIGSAGHLDTPTIANGGALIVSHTGADTLAAAIAGAGTLTQAGSGVLTLSAHNTYSGGTALNAGTLELRQTDGAGTGAITFGSGAQTLALGSGFASGGDLANTLKGFGLDDRIDIEGGGLASSVSRGANNVLTVQTGGGAVTLHLDPAADFSQDVFHLASDGAAGTLVTYAANVAPTALAASSYVVEDTPIDGAVSASDPDGQTLTYALVSGPSHGALTLGSDGAFHYAPGADYNGADSFSFKANDGVADSAPATVSLTVTPVEDAPAANAITGAVNEHATTPVTLTADAHDVDVGDTLGYALDTTGTLGSVVNVGDGTFRYSPNGAFISLAAGAHATDVFHYTVDDGHGGAATATATVTITGEDDAPTALNLAGGAVDENSPAGTVVATLSTADPDASDSFTYAVTDPSGTFAVAGDKLVVAGAVDFEAHPSYDVTLTSTDAGGLSVSRAATITVNDLSDTLYGTAGDDSFDVTPPGLTRIAVIDGGSGNDTLELHSDVTTISVVNGALAVDFGGDGTVDLTVRNVERLVVDGSRLTVSGDLAAAGLAAGLGLEFHGADAGSTLDASGVTSTGVGLAAYGGAGADSFKGGAADDLFVGGAGADTFVGGGGHDTASYAGSSASSGIAVNLTHYDLDAGGVAYSSGFGGDAQGDRLYGVANLIGGAANDILTGSANTQSISGGEGNDYLTAGAGAETLVGGAGNDSYYLASQVVQVVEAPGGGSDIVYASGSYTNTPNVEAVFLTGPILTASAYGLDQPETLTGTVGDNLLAGAGGDDTLNGRAGNDTLLGGLGDDTLNGGTQIDAASYADAAAGVTVSLAIANAAQDTHGAGFDTLIAVENLIGSEHDDALRGGAGANALYGGAGNDTLDGAAGPDTLAGGAGDDTYYVDSKNDQVIEAAGQGYDTVYVSYPTFVLGAGQEVEKLVAAGATTQLHGNDLAQLLVGNDANNLIDGGGGADTMQGGLGNDTYILTSLSQHIVEDANGGYDTVKTALPGYALDDNLEVLTYTGASNFAGAGNASDNLIRGGVGNDTLDGDAGADTLIGGAGDDTYYVDDVGDKVVEAANAGHDQVNATLGVYTLGGNVEVLFYAGSSSFIGTGNALANVINADLATAATLHGGSGADTIVGSQGPDVIYGDLGADVLAGDGGGDTYVYARLPDSRAAEGIDTILGLDDANDHIDLRGVDANTALAGDQAFVLAAAFTHVRGQLVLSWDAAAGLTHVGGDINGDGVADFQLNLQGDHHAFTGFLL